MIINQQNEPYLFISPVTTKKMEADVKKQLELLPKRYKIKENIFMLPIAVQSVSVAGELIFEEAPIKQTGKSDMIVKGYKDKEINISGVILDDRWEEGTNNKRPYPNYYDTADPGSGIFGYFERIGYNAVRYNRLGVEDTFDTNLWRQKRSVNAYKRKELKMEEYKNKYDKLKIIEAFSRLSWKELPVSFRISSPHLENRKIKTVVFSGFSSMEDSESGHITVELAFIEYDPPKKAEEVKTKKKEEIAVVGIGDEVQTDEEYFKGVYENAQRNLADKADKFVKDLIKFPK
ncbi:MAG TPA: hypothetical protein DHW82_01980 [Spirochaetia bacterium]|nr:MAG: hypothetical protein A2Y41_07305 [Spirochaetes bacterium GWB1_36_13]HCL55765.1 hypothetical protein [Spirochaetia bacterium]